MNSSIALQVRSLIATGMYNFDSKRFQKASLETRVEGWTETWGSSANNNDGDDIDNVDDDFTNSGCWEKEKEDLKLLLATSHPQQPIVLTQFRPAWLEQIVLRIAKVPHIVINSTYVCCEATGELPYLRDFSPLKLSLTQKANDDEATKQIEFQDQMRISPSPVLVGRCHPSNLIDRSLDQNDILSYLKVGRGIDLDTCLTSDHQRDLASCFLRMIQSDLDNALMYLRYEDRDAWEQVYRRQYLHAGCLSPHDQQSRSRWFHHIQGRFQASLDRSIWRRRLIEYSGRVHSVAQVLDRVKTCYESLESQLACHSKSYLLGTDNPALVDAYLFSHLADALGDVHLVVVLASFPRLVQFAQMMIQTFFLDSLVENSDWGKWNRNQNESNAFQQIPIMKSTWSSRSTTGTPKFKDAVELMESLTLQNDDLHVVLTTAKTKRDREPWPEPNRPTETLLYRWRMGEDLEMKKGAKNSKEEPENALRKKLMRDQIRNDQMWISGVLGASIIAILLMQGGAAPNTK
jgi:Glutathione S-transferase, C-terminal domain